MVADHKLIYSTKYVKISTQRCKNIKVNKKLKIMLTENVYYQRTISVALYVMPYNLIFINFILNSIPA